MSRSRFSNYKQRVRYILIHMHKWDPRQATAWIKGQTDYMRAMYESASPVSQTAEYIHEVKEKLNNVK